MLLEEHFKERSDKMEMVRQQSRVLRQKTTQEEADVQKLRKELMLLRQKNDKREEALRRKLRERSEQKQRVAFHLDRVRACLCVCLLFRLATPLAHHLFCVCVLVLVALVLVFLLLRW